MRKMPIRGRLAPLLLILVGCASHEAYAQTFGVELHNTLMPAAGGMGGTSIAMPQDLTSAINANPATLTQFRGTQFQFGGGWAEPTFNLSQDAPIPLLNVDPYAAKSTAPGGPAGNIGVTQDFSALGMPVTLGIGFVTTSAGFSDFRHVTESNGTNTASAIFSLPVGLGVDLTDRLHLGASMALGIAFFDAPFVAIGGMTPDYALRGTLGVNYDLTDFTTVGGYYQSSQSYRFDNAVRFGPAGISQDVNMELPQNVGVGLANHAFMDGRLLLATDLLYKIWDEADMFRSVYDNQWVVQVGAQYTTGRYKFRAGYAWAENPLDPNPGINIGGVTPPGGFPAIRYTQALLAVTSEHRVSGGIGVVDVLPGIDMDLMAGGMFRDREQLGASTSTSIASYWIGMGLTWRFGRGACEQLPWANDWGCETCCE